MRATDTDAAGIESICSRAGHDLLYFHGRTDGMRNRCMSGMCVRFQRKDAHSNVKNKRICKEGRYFWLRRWICNEYKCGIMWCYLKNPVMTASGTFGSGAEYSEFTDLNRLGAVVTKGVANVPWPGNPTPRVAEVYGGCSTPWDCRIRELICSVREIFHS